MSRGSDSRMLERLEGEPPWMKRPLVAYLLRSSGAIILCILLFVLYGFFLSHTVDLVTADLGRHIKNGEVLLHDASVLEENYYSYTHPDFHVINHHWGIGFLFYGAWELFGFVGVQLFFILLSLAAFFAFLKTARLYTGWGIAGLAAIPAIFLLAERTEIRPEVFSYLFAGIFFYVLCRHRESVIQENTDDRQYFLVGRTLWLLPIVQILWVNSHIYFLLGPLILGAFLLESLLVRRQYFLRLLGVFAALLVATLLNPFGYRAVSETAKIFQNYGYRLAENQSVWFMEKLTRAPSFVIFKLIFAAVVVSLCIVLVKRWREVRLAHIFVLAGISIMAWLAIRNLALFGLFSIPFIAANVGTIFRQNISERTALHGALWAAAILLALSAIFTLPRYFPYWNEFGWGLQSGNDVPMAFIKEHKIHGPYFNNYDIGGYLIFHLFPDEKVFVDNRPEAYPAQFFQEVYIPMQEDDTIWRQKLEEYKFNAIIFSHRDATPWGQQFLVARVRDAEWAPIFVDARVLILVRRTEENGPLIEQFLLPPETFGLPQ